MFLLVLAQPGCPGQNPESCKMVVVNFYDIQNAESITTLRIGQNSELV